MEVLLRTSVTLTPENERTHTRHAFEVPLGIGKLRIEYRYEPGVEGESAFSEARFREALSLVGRDPNTWRDFLHVNNLVTISLDDPGSFRGMAHRGHNHQHIALSRESATRGFLPGEIAAGTWHVTLSAHAVISPKVTCTIVVEGGAEDE